MRHFISGRKIWLPISGYVGLYEASRRGEIRALPKPKRPWIKVLSQGIDKRYHYPFVWLYKNGKPRRFYVHVLVLLAFRGPRPNKLDSRHLDGNRQNNRLSNLKYGTRKENMQDAVRHGTHKIGFPKGYVPPTAFGGSRSNAYQLSRKRYAKRQKSWYAKERGKR